MIKRLNHTNLFIHILVSDNLLGPKLDLHGAQIHNAKGRVRAGDSAVQTEVDQRVRRGRDAGTDVRGGARRCGEQGHNCGPWQARVSPRGPQVERVQRDLLGQPAQRLLTDRPPC